MQIGLIVTAKGCQNFRHLLNAPPYAGSWNCPTQPSLNHARGMSANMAPAPKLLEIPAESFGGVKPRRLQQSRTTMHPDHFFLLKTASLAAITAVVAKMAIVTALYVSTIW